MCFVDTERFSHSTKINGLGNEEERKIRKYDEQRQVS